MRTPKLAAVCSGTRRARLARGARAVIAGAVAILLAGLIAGCGGGGGGSGSAPPTVVLALDFIPNAVHAPIYTASRLGRDRAHGIRLQIRKPASGPDALRLVTAGAVDLGVLDIHDLAIATQQGAPLVAVGALVDRPLAALIAQPGIHRPRDLEGRTVGVSGLPSDPAFLRAILEHDGARYDRVKQVTIGFSAVSRILSRRVAAAPAFWNAEGVALRRHGLGVSEFRVDDYGAPRYPEVVLITARRTLARHRDRIARALAAIRDGEAGVRADPEGAARQIAHAAETPDVGLVRDELHAVEGAFAPGLRLRPDVLRAWADFDARIGIVARRPDVARIFDLSLQPR